MRPRYEDEWAESGPMTFGVQMLLIANVAVFLLELATRIPIGFLGALRGDWWSTFSVWQLLTYQFIHQGFWHLFANMIGLYFLGPSTERALGTNRFFALYFISGILGGIGWSLLSPAHHFCIGASGAVFGVLGAYAALYPQRKLILIFLPFFPIKAWIFFLLLGLYELTRTIAGPHGTIANAAHLSGGLAGYIYAAILARPDLVAKTRRFLHTARTQHTDRAEIDRILDKAASEGIHTLTPRERERLRKARQGRDPS